MKRTATVKTATSPLHHFGHDLRRDWEAWSVWEQRFVTALGVSSSLFGVFWLAMSLKLVG